MADDPGFTCSCCGEHHAELPMSYSAPAPDIWDESYAGYPDSSLTPERCVIRDSHFFLKGLIEIPVVGADRPFSWGVWVSLSRDDFTRVVELWETAGREAEKPYFGWLTTELALYPSSTLDLKTNAHLRPLGRRPFIELEPTDHPLAVEQRHGITLGRVRQIAESVLHPRR